MEPNSYLTALFCSDGTVVVCGVSPAVTVTDEPLQKGPRYLVDAFFKLGKVGLCIFAGGCVGKSIFNCRILPGG